MARRKKTRKRVKRKRTTSAPRKRKTMPRRRRKTASRRRRRSTGGKKPGLATIAGAAFSAYALYQDYMWMKGARSSSGQYIYDTMAKRAAGLAGLYQVFDTSVTGGYRYMTVKEWADGAMADYGTHPNLIDKIAPTIGGYAISTFVGGNGMKGLPGLGLNKYLPGKVKL